MLLSARQCYLYADDQPIVRTMVVAKNTQVKVVATRCAIVGNRTIGTPMTFRTP